VARLTVRFGDGVFYLSGEFDLAGFETFVRQTDVALEGRDPIVLDLEELTFIDSNGVEAIVSLADWVDERPVILRHPRGVVAQLLELVDLDDSRIQIEGQLD
jgi:anti-anti-sigma factor